MRHTAFVSADDSGLAFYHSLGKVLFVEANDILRILGRYPDEVSPLSRSPAQAATPLPSYDSAASNPSESQTLLSMPRLRTPDLGARRRNRKTSTILDMAPLPFSSSSHPIDTFHVIALLTPIKLVIVGLRPSPRTWFRGHRGGQDGEGSQSVWRGCMAWFPSVSLNGTDNASDPTSGTRITSPDVMTVPILAYSWGRSLMFLRVRAERILHPPSKSAGAKNKAEGKSPASSKKPSSGITYRLVFEDAGEITTEDDILSLQWLNWNVSVPYHVC